jgi:hypothetical protein
LKHLPSIRQRARGQALVETLMVIPLLLLMLLGLITVGQLLLANYTVTQAARAAAHQAALSGGDDQVANQTAADVLDGGVGTRADDAAILVACAHSPCRRYDPITVSITYTGSYWTPLFSEQFTLRSEATRAAERDAQ